MAGSGPLRLLSIPGAGRGRRTRELGTARGLEREPGMPEGYFHITFGNLDVRIFPDASDSSHRSSSRLIQMRIDMDGGPERIARFFTYTLAASPPRFPP